MSTFRRQPRYRGSSRRSNSGQFSSTPAPPFGLLLMTLTQGELDAETLSEKGAPHITDCKYAASYSWVDSKVPTILVPGKPPTWTPLAVPEQLKPDNPYGIYYRDQNSARYPSYPTEPAIQALFTQQPKFPTDTVDVFACGSTLGNLIRFARRIDKSFRFNVEVIGNTVFFVRKENSPTERIEGVQGYGHSFPESYTSWDADVKGSEKHQRIIEYKFGGLKFLVRFESDGFFKDESSLGKSKAYQAAPKSSSELGADSLLNLESWKISSSSSQTTANKKLQIKPAGQAVPQSSIFDVKTRSVRNQINMSDVYPVLWVKQIPHFLLAYHNRGRFDDIRKQDLRDELKDWEESHSEELVRLVALVKKIVEFARNAGGEKLEVHRKIVVDGDEDELEIREQAGNGVNALPSHVKAQWVANMKQTSHLTSSLAETTQTSAPDSGARHGLQNAKQQGGVRLHQDFSDDDDFEPDYTGCSDDCGYCGRCSY